jgi:hypothetical protein
MHDKQVLVAVGARTGETSGGGRIVEMDRVPDNHPALLAFLQSVGASLHTHHRQKYRGSKKTPLKKLEMEVERDIRASHGKQEIPRWDELGMPGEIKS